MSSTFHTGISGRAKLGPTHFDSRGRQRESDAKSPPRSIPRTLTKPVAEPLQVGPAGPGDHPSIQLFLQNVFQAPSSAEFQAQLEDPSYEPSDRLVAKFGERVVSHLRLSKREVNFGSRMLPITLVSDVGTLPEFRTKGCASNLLESAEQQMIEEGSLLGMLSTSVPQFYLQRGWTVCGRHSFSTGRPRDILSYLSATQPVGERLGDYALTELIEGKHPPKKISIRLWRHVERAALIRLYNEATVGTYGRVFRTETYWRWLISRRGYDRVYVAIEGPDKFDLDDELSPIVGYAAMREGRIVELMGSPNHLRVPELLLARACGDAIERDYHRVRFDGPPGDPLHKAMELAGGEHNYHEAENGEVFMAKLFDPVGFLESLCPQLHERAKAAELTRPCELGLQIEDEKYRLSVSRRSVKLAPGKLCRSYLTCSTSQLVQMLLGHLHIRDATESGRLDSSTRIGVEIASALFPTLPMWRSPLDELPAL